MKKGHKITVSELVQIAVFTAIIAAMAQISIPMPAGVPMTMQTFAIPLAGILLGARKGTIATLVYLLLGAVGLPVFAGFTGGIGILFGIPVFILAGFEHSIADLFYFAASGIVSLPVFGFILTVLLGNSIGSVILPLLLFGEKRQMTAEKE